MFRSVFSADFGEYNSEMPVNGWGDRAILCLEEKGTPNYVFNYAAVHGKYGDKMMLWDYLKGGKGDHHDFFSNEGLVNIFFDICRGKTDGLGEYDLEEVAPMIKKGYVIGGKEGIFRATLPIYTETQYESVVSMINDFIETDLASIVCEMNSVADGILSDHSPRYLHSQVKVIAKACNFTNTVCAPAEILIERNVLSTDWHPIEMPGVYVVLSK